MRPFLFILCSALAFDSIVAQGPVITENDIASIGDSYIITNANPAITFDPDATGEDYTWNFASITPLFTDTINWIDEEDTDLFYFFLWLASDIAEQTTSDLTTDYITIEDVFNFYSKDENSFEMSGFAGIISGIPIPIVYSENDVIYEFPMGFEDSFSSVSQFEIEIPGLGGWSEQRSRENVVDGWGSLTTPYDTYHTLRIKSTSEIIDTFIYDVLTIPFTYTTTEYKWLAEDSGIPVFQINVQNVLGSETLTQVMYREGMMINDINTESLPSVLSIINPIASEELLIDVNDKNNSNYTIDILNINGAVMISGIEIHSGVNSISLLGFSSGIYLVTFRSNERIVGIKKFIYEG